MKKSMKRGIALTILSTILTMTACSSVEVDQTETPSEPQGNPRVTMTLSNDMVINLELYPEVAPITVENFLNLIDAHYYEGTVFHRVIANFMIQGGGYYVEDYTIYPKEPQKTIKGEFSENGVQNDIKHVAGVLSMARATDPDSASAQFFICSATSPHLDGAYAAFGMVTDEESLKNVISISLTRTVYVNYSLQNFPFDPIYIVSMTHS